MKIYFIAINIILISIFCSTITGQTYNTLIKKSEYCSILEGTNKPSQPFETQAFMTYSTVIRVDGGEPFLYSPNCNNGDYFAHINFAKLKKSKKWINFFDNLPPEKNFIFEINLQGNLETDFIPTFGHLGGSRTKMEIIEITSIVNVTNKSIKPDYKAETPLAERGKKLQSINVASIFYLLQPQREAFIISDVNEYFSSTYKLTDFNNNIFYKSNHLNLAENNLFKKTETFSVTDGKLEIIADKYKLSGTIILSHNEKEYILKYENTFELNNNQWLLIATKFSNL